MVTSTFESSGRSAIVRSALYSLKWPRTLLTMRWRVVKPTVEWEGSMVQDPVAGTERPSTTRTESLAVESVLVVSVDMVESPGSCSLNC